MTLKLYLAKGSLFHGNQYRPLNIKVGKFPDFALGKIWYQRQTLSQTLSYSTLFKPLLTSFCWLSINFIVRFSSVLPIQITSSVHTNYFACHYRMHACIRYNSDELRCIQYKYRYHSVLLAALHPLGLCRHLPQPNLQSAAQCNGLAALMRQVH